MVDINSLLDELGRRHMTNVLVEGGGRLLGSFFDAGGIDEVHVFIAPKLIGGSDTPSPISGDGLKSIAESLRLIEPQIRQLGDDIYVSGRIARS